MNTLERKLYERMKDVIQTCHASCAGSREQPSR